MLLCQCESGQRRSRPKRRVKRYCLSCVMFATHTDSAHRSSGIEIRHAFHCRNTHDMKKQSSIDPIKTGSVRAMDRERRRIGIRSQPAVECETHFHNLTSSYWPEMQLLEIGVSAIEMNTVAI